MAEPEKTEKGRDAEPALPPNQGPMAKILPWLIIGAVVVGFATGGFLVGRLFGTRGQAQTASAQQASSAENAIQELDPLTGKDEGWFYEVDPVTANLNEPGVTRYARIP